MKWGTQTEEGCRLASFESVRDLVFLLPKGKGFVSVKCNFTNPANWDNDD